MRRGLIRIGKLLLRIVILALVFAASTAFFLRMTNQGTTKEASRMSNSTFPLVYMQKNGMDFNALHGYARQIDPSKMRESITPLSDDRQIDIRIDPFTSSVESISYQVYTLEGEQLENTSVTRYTEENGSYTASLTLQNKILLDQEYVLCIAVQSAGRPIYYYTHVILADGLHTGDYLNFVNTFYANTVNRTNLDSVALAVEPDETTDEDKTLASMDIHDSVSQLTWGSLNPQLYYKPVPRITEINDNTATITMEYRIMATGDSGQIEIYNVNEYYRVRYTDSRVFLLNFERSTDEVFNPDNAVVESTGLRLGITGKDITYQSDERGRVIAFVQENELWSYDRSASRLTQIFSFPQKTDMDYRDFYDAHSISILRVSSTGDIWFTVQGYMNRGVYEGENGVNLCFYSASSNEVEEKLFISSDERYDMLEESVEESAYISTDGNTFGVLIGSTLYRAAVNTKTITTLAEGINLTCYEGSNGERYFAYLQEGKAYGSGTLVSVDLESGNTITVTAPQGQKIRPVGYLGSALVYGLAADEDIALGSVEWGYFPMYVLKIIDGNGNELKTYQPSGLYITGVEQQPTLLKLTRMSKDGSSFVEAVEDQIVDADNANAVSIGSATKTDDRKQTQVYLRVGDSISDTEPQVLYSSIIEYGEERQLLLENSSDDAQYYFVYAAGGLDSIYSRVNEALVEADKKVGVVIDSQQRYVWVRGDKGTTADIPLDKVPEVMKNGVSDLQTLAEGTGLTVLDLTGCTLEQVLYLVSHGTPVTAQTSDGPVTIVGYDEFNTHLLDAGGEEWYYYGMNDSTERFAAAGNVFYAYLKDPAY